MNEFDGGPLVPGYTSRGAQLLQAAARKAQKAAAADGGQQVSGLISKRDESKARHPGKVIVWVRIGDFYETFDDDALAASQVLGRTLSTHQGRPHVGIPYHMHESACASVLAAGYRWVEA